MHPFETAVALSSSANGLLTTPQRQAWNGRAMTAGPAAGLLQPRRVAQALHATRSDSRLGEPRHWDAGTTAHGEWWALRARYSKPAGHPAAGEPVETVITVRHRIGSSELLLQSGWRLPGSGTEILTGDCHVRIRRGRITLQQSPQYDLLAGIADELDASSRPLTAWSTEAVTRNALTSWAAAVTSPQMTHTVAATLIALYDPGRTRRPRRESRDARRRASLTLPSSRSDAEVRLDRRFTELRVAARVGRVFSPRVRADLVAQHGRLLYQDRPAPGSVERARIVVVRLGAAARSAVTPRWSVGVVALRNEWRDPWASIALPDRSGRSGPRLLAVGRSDGLSGQPLVQVLAAVGDARAELDERRPAPLAPPVGESRGAAKHQ